MEREPFLNIQLVGLLPQKNLLEKSLSTPDTQTIPTRDELMAWSQLKIYSPIIKAETKRKKESQEEIFRNIPEQSEIIHDDSMIFINPESATQLDRISLFEPSSTQSISQDEKEENEFLKTLRHIFYIQLMDVSRQKMKGSNIEFSGSTLDNMINNLKNGPRVDHNSFETNYIKHPHFGMIMAQMSYSNSESVSEAFMCALLGTLMWEFGTETLWCVPSVQDNIVTPLGGTSLAMIGIWLEEKLHNNINEKNYNLNIEIISKYSVSLLFNPGKLIEESINYVEGMIIENHGKTKTWLQKYNISIQTTEYLNNY